MVNDLRRAIVIAAVLATVLTACAPAQPSADQVQAQVATQVAATVQAEHQIADAANQTLTAQAPQATATLSPTPVTLNLPATQPGFATATPFVVVPSSGGSGGSGGAAFDYGCTWTEIKPTINVFKPGDPIDVVWVITNTGTKAWPSKKDLTYVSGPHFSPYLGEELPALKSGETVTISFEGNAPADPGLYGMQFKVEGGLCWPKIEIQVKKPGG